MAFSAWRRKLTIVTPGIAVGYWNERNMPARARLSGLQPSTLVVVGARPSMGKCVAWDTPIVDPATGAVCTAAEVHAAGLAGADVSVPALGRDGDIVVVHPSAFVDDGFKPVYRVRTDDHGCFELVQTRVILNPTFGRLAQVFSVFCDIHKR